MVENLLDGVLDDRQLRLLEEADSFDLEDFYLGLGTSSGGVCLITQNQMLMTNCYIKYDPNSTYAMHLDTVDDIYKAIYGIDDLKYNKVGIWQDRVINNGDILIQICNNKLSNIIWVPEEISQEQYEMLEFFSHRLDTIISNNLDYFEEKPIVFECRIGKETLLSSTNGIHNIIDKIKVREVENGKRIY